MADKTGTSIEVADPFARRLVTRYLERRAQDLDILDMALANGDFEVVRNTGHNLCGSGSAYGLDEISRIGRAIEHAAEQRDADAVRQHLADLADFVHRVKIR